MADRVIILDVKRNRQMIPIIEIAQCAGRAGRKQTDTGMAKVDIICSSGEAYQVENSLLDEDSYKVNSVFNDNENIGFHLVSEIYNGLVYNKVELVKWYESSFAFLQGNTVNNIEDVVKHLEYLGCIVVDDGIYKTTKLGDICATLYFSPEDVFCWSENFKIVFANDKQFRDGSLVWALSNIHTDLGISVYDEELLDMFLSEIDFSLESNQIGRGLAWWYLFGGASVKEVKGIVGMLRNDLKRILKALLKIFDYNNFDFEILDAIETVVQHRIGMEYYQLCKIDGIGKSYAFELYNLGLSNETDIINNLEDVYEHIESVRLKKILKEAYGNSN